MLDQNIGLYYRTGHPCCIGSAFTANCPRTSLPLHHLRSEACSLSFTCTTAAPQRGGISLPPDFRTSGTSHLVHASRPRAEPRFCPREPHAEGERGVSVLGLLGRDLRGGIRGWSERGSSLATRSSELGLSSEEFAGHGVLRRQ